LSWGAWDLAEPITAGVMVRIPAWVASRSSTKISPGIWVEWLSTSLPLEDLPTDAHLV
jgi:hypothetical protein